MTDEHTSPEVAAIAARVLTMDDADIVTFAMSHPADLRSMAASLVTQAKDTDWSPDNEPADLSHVSVELPK